MRSDCETPRWWIVIMGAPRWDGRVAHDRPVVSECAHHHQGGSTVKYRRLALSTLACTALAWATAPARAETVQPQKGQSSEQQQQDVSECQASAKQSSGYDPAAPPVSAAPEEKGGGRVAGAAK